MTQANLEEFEFSLTPEQREDELIGYNPMNQPRVHPSVPELSIKQWQTLCCHQDYKKLTYNQAIRKFVRLNYPDLWQYYESVGWNRCAEGNLSIFEATF